MNFQLKILLLSYVVSTVIACIVIPILKRRNIKQTERELGIQETIVGRKSTVPTMGGLIIIASTIVLSVFLFFNYNAEDPEIASRLLPMIFVTIGFGAIGLIDDFKKVILRNEDGLSPKAKMAGLVVIAAIYICLLLFTLTTFSHPSGALGNLLFPGKGNVPTYAYVKFPSSSFINLK